MKGALLSATAALIIYSGSARAWLVHSTCTKGVSPALRLVCHTGLNEDIDALVYDSMQGYCQILGQFSSNSVIVQVNGVESPKIRDTGAWVGCPEGYWAWTAVTRERFLGESAYTQWHYWPEDGSYHVYSCTLF